MLNTCLRTARPVAAYLSRGRPESALVLAAMAPKRKAASASKADKIAPKKFKAPQMAEADNGEPVATTSDGRKLSLIIEAW